MKSAEYWKQRSEQLALRQFNKADQYSADLLKEYKAAIQSIQKDIEVFYARYAKENEASLADARKLLSPAELKGFRMSIEEFTAKAKDNLDGRWTNQLNTAYYRTRISRFEALQMQIRQQVEMLMASRQGETGKLLGDVYSDTYYRTLYEIQKGTGIGASFAKIDSEGLQKVLGAEFAGSNWSKRIWGDRDKLTSEIYTKLSQSFIRGDDVHKTSKDIAQRMGVSYSNAKRLVNTETAFFTEQGTMEGYRQSGIVDEFEFLATLDMKTSDICRSMDGKVFEVSEQEVGVNCPPLHGHCRSTTVPRFKDEENPGERFARDKEGKVYYVPGDIDYRKWYNDYVINTPADKNSVSKVFKPFASVKDAEDYTVNALGFSKVSFKGLNLDVVNSLTGSMYDIYQKYPEIKGFASQFSVSNSDKYAAQAGLVFDQGRITANLKVSSKFFNDKDIDSIIELNVKYKHWPEGTTKESVLAHEFGHIIEYAHALKRNKTWVAKDVSLIEKEIIFNDIRHGMLSQEIKKEALKTLGLEASKEVIMEELSGYAVTSSLEFLAEAFAEAECSKSPRRLSKEVLRLLKEKLKEVGLL